MSKENKVVVVVVANGEESKETEQEETGEERGRKQEKGVGAVRHISRSPMSRSSLLESVNIPLSHRAEVDEPKEKEERKGKETEPLAVKPSYITTTCETMRGDGLHPYSIRGHCIGEFFRKTVNAFYARHPEVVRAEAEAHRFVDGQWCTFFSAGTEWTKYEQPDWPVFIPESERVQKNDKQRRMALTIPKNAIPRK